MDLCIKYAKVLIGNDLIEKDVIIHDGKIHKISNERIACDEIIKGSGLIVLPGLIDSHVHFREPGETKKEDFLSGSRAAAAGGVTTVIDMPNNRPAITTAALLEEKRNLAKKSVVNYGFHFGATENNLDEINSVSNIGAVKTVLGATTGDLLVENEDSLSGIFSSGKRVMVHAEDGALIKKNEERYKGQKTPDIHGKIRTPACAVNAVEKAVRLSSTETRLHIAHVSTEAEMKVIGRAKVSMNLTCEATPHHLFLNEKDLGTLENFGKVNPPLRAASDVRALWSALNDGTIDTIATDHAPHLPEEKREDYWHAPSGVPGVETMLPLLLDAVNKDRLSLQKLVQLTSTNPARIFGISGKGSVGAGMDADLVLVDMHKQKTIKNSDVVSKCGWTPFDGRTVEGAIDLTIVNGKIVYDGELLKNRGSEVEFSD